MRCSCLKDAELGGCTGDVKAGGHRDVLVEDSEKPKAETTGLSQLHPMPFSLERLKKVLITRRHFCFQKTSFFALFI